MNDSDTILTPVGRLVQGDVFKPNDKDATGRPLMIKNGPNAGQPRVEYFMAIAILKTDPEWPALHALLYQTAQASFPHLFDASGACIAQFSFKVRDGDSQQPDQKGVRPCDRPGFAGCWIVGFSSGFPPAVCTVGGKTPITDPSQLKRGYYIRISGSVKGNGSVQNPGLFLNVSMVELVGYGEEIATGPNPTQVFGGKPAKLPPGASATPIAPQAQPGAMGAGMPPQPQPGAMGAGMPPQPQPGAMGAGMPAQPQPGAMGAGMPPQPQSGAMGAGMPPQPQSGAMGAGMPPQPQSGAMGAGMPAAPATDYLQPQGAAPQEKTYALEGKQFTHSQLLGFGWTEQQIAAIPDDIPF